MLVTFADFFEMMTQHGGEFETEKKASRVALLLLCFSSEEFYCFLDLRFFDCSTCQSGSLVHFKIPWKRLLKHGWRRVHQPSSPFLWRAKKVLPHYCSTLSRVLSSKFRSGKKFCTARGAVFISLWTCRAWKPQKPLLSVYEGLVVAHGLFFFAQTWYDWSKW